MLPLTKDEEIVIYQRRNWQAGSPFATHDANGKRYKYCNEPRDGLDPGIAPYVRILYDNGIETFESCEGGYGHACPEPTIRFHGGHEAGFRAYAIARGFGLPVQEIRRCWDVYPNDNELVGPHWEIVFRQRAPGTKRDRSRPPNPSARRGR